MLNEAQYAAIRNFVQGRVEALLQAYPYDQASDLLESCSSANQGAFESAVNTITNPVHQAWMRRLRNIYFEIPEQGANGVLNVLDLGPAPQPNEIREWFNTVVTAAVTAMQHIEAEQPPFWSKQAKEAVLGVGDALWAPIELVSHPVQTFINLKNAALHPITTGQQIAAHAYQHPVRFSAGMLTGYGLGFFANQAVSAASTPAQIAVVEQTATTARVVQPVARAATAARYGSSGRFFAQSAMSPAAPTMAANAATTATTSISTANAIGGLQASLTPLIVQSPELSEAEIRAVIERMDHLLEALQEQQKTEQKTIDLQSRSELHGSEDEELSQEQKTVSKKQITQIKRDRDEVEKRGEKNQNPTPTKRGR